MPADATMLKELSRIDVAMPLHGAVTFNDRRWIPKVYARTLLKGFHVAIRTWQLRKKLCGKTLSEGLPGWWHISSPVLPRHFPGLPLL
jgi:hypothetical protein